MAEIEVDWPIIFEMASADKLAVKVYELLHGIGSSGCCPLDGLTSKRRGLNGFLKLGAEIARPSRFMLE